MAIQAGLPAPDFSLKNQNEEDFKLSDHKGKRVVLLWYPLDWSPTCEKEHCRIGDDIDLSDDNTIVVGISRDSTWSHKAFKHERNIGHDLLADPMLEVTDLYGLRHPGAPFISHRATVIVDSQGNIGWAQVQENTGDERDWDTVQGALKDIK